MVSNGRKSFIDFSSVKKFEKIWIFIEVKIGLRKNSAVMQTSNSGKSNKIFINVKKWSKHLPKLKKTTIFFSFETSFRVAAQYILKWIANNDNCFKKTYEISDFAP